MRSVRAIVYGLGSVGRLTTKLLRERGVDVVAAYVRTVEGKDFSAPELRDVEICRPDVPFEKFGADVALLTHCTTIADLFEPAMRAAAAGLDVATIAEDAFDPFYVDADLARCHQLDAAFRSNGRTLCSVGVQDTFWFAQPLAFTAAADRIDRLIGRNIADLGAFGRGALHHPINLSEQEFAARPHRDAHGGRGVFPTGLRPLIRALGWNVTAVQSSIGPVFAEKDMYIEKFDVRIEAGKTRGTVDRTVFELDSGRTLEGEFIMTFLPEGETAHNEWIIEGSPSMNMRTDNFAGDVITSASLVNRVYDVMAAQPGFLSVDQLPAPRLRQSLSVAQ